MATISKVLVQHFGEAGIKYEQSDDPSRFLALFTLHSGSAMLVCNCREEAQQLIVRVLLPFQAAAQRRPAVAEFLARVNYSLVLGNFEMDYSDGTLSFRVGIDVENDHLTPALVRSLIACALTTADFFYESAAAVAVGGITPALALEMAQAKAPGKRASAPVRPLFGRLSADLRGWLN